MKFYGRKAVKSFRNTSQKMYYISVLNKKDYGNSSKLPKQFEQQNSKQIIPEINSAS